MSRKWHRAALLLAICALLGSLVNGWGPATARAMPAGRAGVLALLAGLPGQHRVLSGQHNREPSATPFGWDWNRAPASQLYAPWSQKVADITGVRPAVWSADFLYSAPFTASGWRQALTDQAIAQWRSGSLVTLTWHMCPPTAGPSCAWKPVDGSDSTAVNSTLTDDHWQRMLTTGDPLNTALLRRFDEAVPYLTQLRAAGVPVLFRPFHEINDGWSWWGATIARSSSRQQAWRTQLFRLLHDHYTGKGLDNLVWVWAVKDILVNQHGDPASANPRDRYSGGSWIMYPGSAYVDVIGVDLWNNRQPPPDLYAELHDLDPTKPLALTEVAQHPNAAALAAQPLWTYSVVWAEYINTDCAPITKGDGSSLCLGHDDPVTGQVVSYNTNKGTKDFYYRPNTLRQGQF